MCTQLAQYWTDDITKINIAGVTDPTTLNDERAQRVFDGATVVIVNRQVSDTFYFAPDSLFDNNSIKPHVLGADIHYIVRYVNSVKGPQGQRVFQLFWVSNGNFISHYNHDDVFQASGNANDLWESYFSFVYNEQGKIVNMITYSPFHMGNQFQLSPYQSLTENNYMRADWNDGERFTCSLWLQLEITSPSPYTQALTTFNPLSCCTNKYTTDPTAELICADQGLTSFTSPSCLTGFAAFCTGDNLLTPECQQYCALPNANCDSAISQYATQQLSSKGIKAIQSDPTLSNVLGCFLGSNFYNNAYNDIVQLYPTMGTLPNLPQCWFPYCSTPAAIKPYSVKQYPTSCPPVTSCFSQIEVTNSGTIAGSIPISQSESCTSLTQTSPAQPGGQGGASSTTTTTTTIIIIVSVIVGIIFIIGVIYLFVRRSRTQRAQAAGQPIQQIAQAPNLPTRYGRLFSHPRWTAVT